MTTLLWLLACGPRWTEVDAVAPTLARLDTDKSGTVTEAEYVAVAFHGAPFAKVDTDESGTLSAEELLAVVIESNPADMTVPRSGPQVVRGRKKGKDKDPKQDAAKATPKAPGGAEAAEPSPEDAKRIRSEAQYVVRMTLESLREEVRSVAPNHPVPNDDEIKVAAGTSDLHTVESRALLLRLEAAADAVGVGFPTSLRAAALATAPVVASFVPSDEPDEPEVMGPWGAGGKDAGPGGPRRGGPGGPGGPRGPGKGPPNGAEGGDPKGAPNGPRTPGGTP